MENFIGQPTFNLNELQRQDAMFRVQMQIEEAMRNLIKKQIDEIPQMSNR